MTARARRLPMLTAPLRRHCRRAGLRRSAAAGGHGSARVRRGVPTPRSPPEAVQPCRPAALRTVGGHPEGVARRSCLRARRAVALSSTFVAERARSGVPASARRCTCTLPIEAEAVVALPRHEPSAGVDLRRHGVVAKQPAFVSVDAQVILAPVLLLLLARRLRRVLVSAYTHVCTQCAHKAVRARVLRPQRRRPRRAARRLPAADPLR